MIAWEPMVVDFAGQAREKRGVAILLSSRAGMFHVTFVRMIGSMG